MSINNKMQQFTQQQKSYCFNCANDLSTTLCTFWEDKALSQARSKNFQFILTFLPSFFHDIFNTCLKEILQRDQIWTMMTKACIDGSRSEVGGFFSLNWQEDSLFLICLISKISNTETNWLPYGRKEAQAKAFLYYGVATAFIFELNIIKYKLTSHFIWSSSCQSTILLILPPPPAYSWKWCGLWQLFGLCKLKGITAWQRCFCLTSACTGWDVNWRSDCWVSLPNVHKWRFISGVFWSVGFFFKWSDLKTRKLPCWQFCSLNRPGTA